MDSLSKRQEKLANRLLRPKPIKRSEDDVSVVGALGMTWYFEGFLSKFVLSLAMFSLLYSAIRILVQGFW